MVITLFGQIKPALSDASEPALTVAFIYNFIKLSEWPESSDNAHITLCLSPLAEISKEIQVLSGKQISGKKILIKQIEQNKEPENCQLLYLSRADNAEHIVRWIKTASNSATLLVGNYDALLEIGGMIAIFNDGERLQFDVNLEPVKRAKIKLSSEMLKIAHSVKGN